ncbi:MAG TPA: hypothetical protein VM734_27140 [Kofleriaceae bacterium]|jgi:hypothetical protein|nr:hypothetical protein [Kofleriaceae bacterium]
MDAALLAALLDRADGGDPAAADELFGGGGDGGPGAAAAELGGDLGFRFACAELTYLLDRAADLADDRVRELYSALLEAHGGDPRRLAALRSLGERIHQLESDGILPRSMVVRSRRRRD